MRKIILLFIFSFIAASCERNAEPIEKYDGGKYVVTNKIEAVSFNEKALQLKNKDTIFWITVLNFDAENIKVGDTIK